MKKQLISMVVSLLVLQGCGSNSEKEDSITNDSEYKLSFRSWDNEADGVINNTMSLTYNNKGDVLTRKVVWNPYDINNIIVWLWTNDYNKYGKLTISTQFTNDNETSVTTYAYNGNGNLIKKSKRDTDGVIETYEYIYGSNGNIIKESKRDSDGVIESIDKYTYDEYHNILTDSRDFDGDGMVDYITSYTYNENNKIVTKITTYNDEDIANGIVSGDVRTYSYDGSGNLIEEVEKDEDGEITERNIYTYDASNNLIKELEQDEYSITTSTYTYIYSGDEKKVIENYDNDNDGKIDDITTHIWIKI